MTCSLLAAGCGTWPPSGPKPEVIDGNRGAPSQVPPGTAGRTQGEPNGSFDDALIAVFDDDGVAKLQGTISAVGDVDVFQLGAMEPGDRIIVDAGTPGSRLDINIALFDDMQRLVSVNDDRDSEPEAQARDLDAYLDFITRHHGAVYYAVVSASSFADGNRRTGAYTIDIQLERGTTIPASARQILLLDFDGGEVDSPTLGKIRLDPFDAADIALRYEDATDAMKEWIRQTVEQNYERFNVTVVTTNDDLPQGHYSTIFFGGFKENILGFAEGVDEYNVDHCDDAIVYTESFGLDLFFFPPTARQMATAIGNVAAHESGHILGLSHVNDDRALMDADSNAPTLLTDQEFREAPLSKQIAPIGVQDAVLLLTESVGLLPE